MPNRRKGMNLVKMWMSNIELTALKSLMEAIDNNTFTDEEAETLKDLLYDINKRGDFIE